MHAVSEADNAGVNTYLIADLCSQWSLSGGFQTAGSLGCWPSNVAGMWQYTAKEDKLLREAVAQRDVPMTSHLTLPILLEGHTLYVLQLRAAPGQSLHHLSL